MIRTILAAATAAALVFTPPLARPAAAETGEALGLLLGIGFVHALGKGIERAREPAPEPALQPERITHRKEWPARQDGRRLLPRECLATHQTWHGEIRGFGAGCLEDRMRRADRLPRHCAVHTRVGGRDRTIYSVRCLQIEGWEIARAGRDDQWQRPRKGYGPGWSWD